MTLCGLQCFLGLHDVLAQQADGLFNLASAAGLEQLIMLALRTLLAGRPDTRPRKTTDMTIVPSIIPSRRGRLHGA